MTQAPAQLALSSSRLVHLLTDLAVADVEPSHKEFAWRFGQLIGLSDSISLAALHGELAGLDFEPRTTAGDTAQQEFLRVRKSLVQSIVDSFATGDDSTVRNRFPMASEGGALDMPAAYEPYHRFYTAHQRAIDFQLKHLQSCVRDAAAGQSPALARLAALDAALGDMLQLQQRKSFAAIPKLLAKRFEQLLREHRSEPDSQRDGEAWQHKFRTEMQGVLLAELEVRLQLVQGTIEAIHEDQHEQADQRHD